MLSLSEIFQIHNLFRLILFVILYSITNYKITLCKITLNVNHIT